MKGRGELARAFEVEQSTSICSGILLMNDLALSLSQPGAHFYLVAPEEREMEVIAQMARPALSSEPGSFLLGNLPSGAPAQHCHSMCRFGVDRSVLLKIARSHGMPG